MKGKIKPIAIKVTQGSLIGVGAVLPGISGGVLCVIFGIYKTIMEFLAAPVRNFKTHVPKLIPVGIGGVIGFLGIANLLSFLLDRYPAQSVCVFIGLISGMVPSLFREAGEKEKYPLEGDVVVIGGGNVAIDAARISKRVGDYKVSMFCLENRQQMPASLEEITEAEEENVEIQCGWGPKEIITENGKVSGVVFKKCISVTDAEGYTQMRRGHSRHLRSDRRPGQLGGTRL